MFIHVNLIGTKLAPACSVFPLGILALAPTPGVAEFAQGRTAIAMFGVTHYPMLEPISGVAMLHTTKGNLRIGDLSSIYHSNKNGLARQTREDTLVSFVEVLCLGHTVFRDMKHIHRTCRVLQSCLG